MSPAPPGWHSLHCHLRWPVEQVDEFLTETVAPLLTTLRNQRAVADWFFIRYTEGGPHLRIRLRTDSPPVVARVAAHLRAGVAAHPTPADPSHVPVAGEAAHGDVREIGYEPEVRRYGGPATIRVAERVFCRSTDVALTVLMRRLGPAQRLASALDLTLATALALDLDELGTARWLRRHALALRWHRERDAEAAAEGPAAPVPPPSATSQGPGVARRWRAVQAAVAVGHGHLGAWGAEVRVADAELLGVLTDRQHRLRVWAAQLHMLCNRLGIWPDEERALSGLLAASLPAPNGPVDFFADGIAAADRRYLHASRYLPASTDQQRPRPPQTDQPRGTDRPRGTDQPQPASDGSLDVGDLNALLWSVGGWSTHDVTRLRLIASHVEGLAAGRYESDGGARKLLPMGTAPPTEQVAASLVRSADAAAAAQGDGPSSPPAVIGLYVRLGALRERYGLRAMRLAFLEAGRLAQRLAATAAELGLALDIVGEFHDDLAQELFLLDGIDDVLVCLLSIDGPRIDVDATAR